MPTYAEDLLPNTTGLNLGSPTQQWDAYIRNLTINGTLTGAIGGTPGGSNTQVQFNDGGAFGGNAGFTFDKTTGSLALSKTSTLTAGSIEGITSAMTSNPSGATSADFRPILITNTIPLTNSQNSIGRFIGLNIGVDDYGTGNRTHATQGLSGITSTVETLSNAANSITWMNGIRSAVFNLGTGGNTVNTQTAFVGSSGMTTGGGSATTTFDYTYRAEPAASDATHVMTHHYAYFARSPQTGGAGNPDGWAFYSEGAGDKSRMGLLQIGTVTSYNAIATVSNGVPAEYATVDLTAQTASVGTTTLYAVPAVGVYRVSYYVKITTAGSSSGSVSLAIGYTDRDDSVAVTFTVASPTNATDSTSVASGTLILDAKASTNITYATTYASSGGTAMVYKLRLKLEAL